MLPSVLDIEETYVLMYHGRPGQTSPSWSSSTVHCSLSERPDNAVAGCAAEVAENDDAHGGCFGAGCGCLLRWDGFVGMVFLSCLSFGNGREGMRSFQRAVRCIRRSLEVYSPLKFRVKTEDVERKSKLCS